MNKIVFVLCSVNYCQPQNIDVVAVARFWHLLPTWSVDKRFCMKTASESIWKPCVLTCLYYLCLSGLTSTIRTYGTCTHTDIETMLFLTLCVELVLLSFFTFPNSIRSTSRGLKVKRHFSWNSFNLSTDFIESNWKRLPYFNWTSKIVNFN